MKWNYHYVKMPRRCCVFWKAKNYYILFYHKLHTKCFHVTKFFLEQQYFLRKVQKTVAAAHLTNFRGERNQKLGTGYFVIRPIFWKKAVFSEKNYEKLSRVIIVSQKCRSVIFECKLKNMYEVILLESILIWKKILWRINFVLIKFLPNALLFQKLRINGKIHHFSIRLHVLDRTPLAVLSSFTFTAFFSRRLWISHPPVRFIFSSAARCGTFVPQWHISDSCGTNRGTLENCGTLLKMYHCFWRENPEFHMFKQFDILRYNLKSQVTAL